LGWVKNIQAISAKRLLLTTALLFFYALAHTQNIDLENVGKNIKGQLKQKKKIKISGGVSANTVFYTGNAGAGREPFNYFLSGNVSVGLFNINIPISFNYTNSGFSYRYALPRLPNRLSIHPKYKWATAHIGNVSMSFSPYTLNGVVFSGSGVDLAPKGKWKFSAMYGRLQKAIPYTPGNSNALTTYKRMGYGTKVGYDTKNYKATISLFTAKDIFNSLVIKPDSAQIFPQQNTSISLEGSMPIIPNLQLKAEMGMSVLTRDIRAPLYGDSAANSNIFIKLFGGRTSTNIFKAVKADLNYTIGSSMMGIGFEKVDPGYSTLGAYYFNNDLQNITVQFAQSLFKGKVNFSGNVGWQKDDLKKKKSGGSSRTLMAVNVNYNASPRFTTTATYSNFQTVTNVKPQFQLINQFTPFNNLDTLDFRQLSQNANINANIILKQDKEKPQNLNLNLSFQDSYDMQGGIIKPANASRFYNFAGAYSRVNNKKAMSLSGAFNLTYNFIGLQKIVTTGPTVSVNKQLWNKKVRTGLSASYNTTISSAIAQTNVFIARLNAGYVYKKKHNFSLNFAGMNRQTAGKGTVYDYTSTIAYNYNF
jgi:hypothetical protein